MKCPKNVAIIELLNYLPPAPQKIITSEKIITIIEWLNYLPPSPQKLIPSEKISYNYYYRILHSLPPAPPPKIITIIELSNVLPPAPQKLIPSEKNCHIITIIESYHLVQLKRKGGPRPQWGARGPRALCRS